MPDAAPAPAIETGPVGVAHRVGQSIAGGRLSRRSRQDLENDPQIRGIFVSPMQTSSDDCAR
jgi:hypothetical protein